MDRKHYTIIIMVIAAVFMLNIGADCLNDLFDKTPASDGICITQSKTESMSLIASAMLICLGLEKKAWAVSEEDCKSFCTDNYTGEGSADEKQYDHCLGGICLKYCVRYGADPCTTPAWDPTTYDPIARCKCAGECCKVIGDQPPLKMECCGRGTTEEKCCHPDGCCTLTGECCNGVEVCCQNKCCEGECTLEGCCPAGREKCGCGREGEAGVCYECCDPGESCLDDKCCPVDKKCGDKCCTSAESCLDGECCPSSQSFLSDDGGLICCPGSEKFCGDKCCDPDKCINGECEVCPPSEEPCGEVCCSEDTFCAGEIGGRGVCCPDGTSLCQNGDRWDCCTDGETCCKGEFGTAQCCNNDIEMCCPDGCQSGGKEWQCCPCTGLDGVTRYFSAPASAVCCESDCSSATTLFCPPGTTCCFECRPFQCL